MSGSLPLLVLDLDDTLVDTSDVYWTSRSQFVDTLSRYGIDPHAALELFEEQDAENMREMGFHPSRYGKTMRDVYASLVREGKLPHDSQLAADLQLHGQIVVDQLPELLSGAKDLLGWASSRFKLLLLTRGIEDIQHRKISYLKIVAFFDEIRVVRTKGAQELRDLIADHHGNPSETWVVGDSIRSDINPALEVGANPILFAYRHHSYYWRQEYGSTPLGSFYKVESLLDVICVLQSPSSYKRITPQDWQQYVQSIKRS